MTRHSHPEAGTLVELAAGTAFDAAPCADDEPMRGVRVVESDSDSPVVTLSVAAAAVPEHGSTVTLRWPAGPRGRYVQAGTVTGGAGENRVTVELTGTPDLEQQRNYVRAGGGEEVLMRRPGEPDTMGWVRDLSERSVRAHFADVVLQPGAAMVLHIQLETEVVAVPAVVAKVASMQQSLPRRGPMSVEIVAMFTADETTAKTIRRYVLQQQLLNRARTGTN